MLLIALLVGAALPSVLAASSDVIRLGPRGGTSSTGSTDEVQVAAPRRGFDHASFSARLESMWFQRKARLSSGRADDARAELEQIRAFCAEEGIKRIEHLASALIAEAHRYLEEGNHEQALTALEFAEAFDPHRPQIHVARAAVLWESGGGIVPTLKELIRSVSSSATRSLQDLSLFPRLAFLVGLAWLGAAMTFGVLMMVRYQAPFRHEVQEITSSVVPAPGHEIAGWIALGLPVLIWVGVGWAALYWLAVTFRFMSRHEKLATTTLLLAGALTLPGYGLAVGLYGTSADPAVRTTVTSVGGEYAPERIVQLRRLVETHPDDLVYRFLLAGLYKNGRYFEEAFAEYRGVLEHDPTLVPAHVNIGNIFYSTGQYSAAISSYHRALEIEPASFLAHFNLHLAQSEDFHFTEAEDSLQRARMIDADRVAGLLSNSSGFDDRASVQDASLEMVSVWQAAVGGRQLSFGELRHAGIGSLFGRGQFVNVIAIGCLLALAGGGAGALMSARTPPARRCIRCGRPFCRRCKSSREAQEYCSQCLHLFVLRDGLAPETKARKLFEVSRHERGTAGLRRLTSLFLPGSGLILRGQTTRGLVLLAIWIFLVVAALPELTSFVAGPGLDPAPDLLAVSEVPVRFDPHPSRYLAALALPIVWFSGNVRLWRKET